MNGGNFSANFDKLVCTVVRIYARKSLKAGLMYLLELFGYGEILLYSASEAENASWWWGCVVTSGTILLMLNRPRGREFLFRVGTA
jgi:hypothetical protein